MQCEAYKKHCPKCDYKYDAETVGFRECPECGTKRARCKGFAVTGYRFCKYHGGPNPRNNFYGLGGGKLTTGTGAQFPLARLAGKYMQMQKDGRLLSNRASLEVVRDRIRQLAERIDLNQAPDRLDNIKKLWENYKQRKGQVNEVMAEAELDEEFEKAYHDYAAWKQMFDAIDIDRKLVESEVKIVKEIHAVLTAEDAYELTAQLLASVVSAVHGMTGIDDTTKLNFIKRIQYEFTRIVGDRSTTRSGGSGGEVDFAEGGELDRE